MPDTSNANNDTFSEAITLTNTNEQYASPQQPMYTQPTDQSRATQAPTTTTTAGTGTVGTLGGGQSHITYPRSAYRHRSYSGYQSGAECACDTACGIVMLTGGVVATFATLTACLACGNRCEDPF